MRSVAEGRIGREFAVAQLEVARLRDVELHRATSSHDPFALPIAQGGSLGVTTSTPVIYFASVEVHMGGEDAGVGGERGGSVPALLVVTRLHQVNYLLLREISDIVH